MWLLQTLFEALLFHGRQSWSLALTEVPRVRGHAVERRSCGGSCSPALNVKLPELNGAWGKIEVPFGNDQQFANLKIAYEQFIFP